MPFSNPILAGNTLVRDAIRSPNYAAGSTGWTVNADGSAEFNNINIRGSGLFGTVGGQRVQITNTGLIRIYDSGNNLVVALDATGLGIYAGGVLRTALTAAGVVQGYDAGGNLIWQGSDTGLTVNQPGTASQGRLTFDGTRTLLQMLGPALSGHTLTPLQAYAASIAPDQGYGIIESPSVDGGTTARVDLYGVSSITAHTLINLAAHTVTTGAGTVMPGGLISSVTDVTDSAAVTAETLVLGVAANTYVSGRQYRAKFGALVSTSNAGGRAAFRAHKTNVAGQVLFAGGAITVGTAGGIQAAFGEFYFSVTGASVTAGIILALQNLDGGVNTATHKSATATPRYLVIEDVGAAGGWPGTILL